MGSLIDGKAIAEKINKKTSERVAKLVERGITPKLSVILVGEDKPSQTYVRNKANAANKVGISFLLEELPGSISTEDLLKKIDTLQADPELSGMIVQLPLPEQIDTNRVINAIRPEIDVDCLTEANLGKLIMKTNTIVPPTPGAVMSILHEHNIELVGTNVTIIGVGPLVGKPMAVMMMNERASVTTCNSATKDIAKKCRAAKVIVTGVGTADIVRGDMISPGAVVIDTGVDFVNKQMVGDVNVDEILPIASLVTPTPGGVGPITVARLLWNTLLLTEKQHPL